MNFAIWNSLCESLFPVLHLTKLWLPLLVTNLHEWLIAETKFIVTSDRQTHTHAYFRETH